MARYATGTFIPKNKKKYIGEKYPTFRSGWEKRVFQWLDETPKVISWASEPIKIPYINPLKQDGRGKPNHYIPDILFTYLDKSNNRVTELLEIKPSRPAIKELAKTKKDREAYIVNEAKWKQAEGWCKVHGISFRILTEKDIFGIK